MKDHVKEERHIYIEDSVESLIDELRTKSEGLVDPYVTNLSWGGDPDYAVVGWRPMTEKELEKAKARRLAEKASKEALKRKQEEKEREMLAKLKAKYDA